MWFRRLLALTLLICAGTSLLAQAPGSFDASFNPADPGFSRGDGLAFTGNDYVNVLTYQPDGKVLIGGNFVSFNGTARKNIARLNSDGTLDATFTPGTGASDMVWAIAVLPDGKILVGGQFTTYNGVARQGIVRLNSNGTVDNTFTGTGTGGAVRAIVLQPDGKILIGGSFFSYSGTTKPWLARLNADGTLDAGFASGVNPSNQVLAIALQPDGKILIGGSFTAYASTTANHLARLNADGSLDGSFSTGTGTGTGAGNTSDVRTIAVQADGKIIVGGHFTIYNGVTKNRIVRLNSTGSIDATFNMGTGFTYPSSSGPFITQVNVLPDSKILVVHLANTYNGTPVRSLTRLFSNGTLDNSFALNEFVGNIGQAVSVEPGTGKIVAAGTTSYALYKGVIRLSADGALDPSFNRAYSATDQVSRIIPTQDGKFFILGTFRGYNEMPGTVVRLNPDGVRDTTYKDIINGGIGSMLELPDGKLLVSGDFYIYPPGVVGYTERYNLARLNANGSLDQLLATSPAISSNGINLMVPQPDGRILISGSFTSYKGTAVNRIARIYADGTLDASFNAGAGPQYPLSDLVLQPDGKILIGGSFTTYNGTNIGGIARLNADGTLDGSFTSALSANPSVMSIVLQPDGKILIGGSFSSYGGVSRNNIARLNTDGTLDAGFSVGTGANSSVFNMALQANGKVVVAGNFTTFNAVSKRYITRLNPDGTADAGFSTGTGGSATMRAVYLQPDGKIVVGGNFVSYNNNGRNRLLRLHGDVLPTISTGTVAPATLCPGNSIGVSFTITGSYSAGNVFAAQLSDAAGSFASPVAIGTLSSTAAGTISATIPAATPAGNGYRIRVVASDPAVTGSANGSNLAITGSASATIGYRYASYCNNYGTDTVMRTGTPGGVYSAAPAGLSIDAATGALDLNASAPGNYTVTYTIAGGGSCPSFTTTTQVAVTAAPTAGISYSGSPYCSNAGTAAVTLSGAAGGYFSAAPAGLSINSSTGAINIGASTPGTYTVTYFISSGNGCGQILVNTPVVIDAAASAAIDYGADSYCLATGTVTVTRSGSAGGVFAASPNGLNIHPATGVVNTMASVPGTYVVTYTIGAQGGCPAVVATDTLSIQAPPTVDPVPNQSVCPGGTTAPVSFAGTGTSFAWTNSTPSIGLPASGTGNIASFTAINTGAGAVTATISVTPSANGCTGASSPFTITVSPATAANVAYGSGTFCGNGSVSPTAQQPSGGVFTSTSGLSLNSSTGVIDLSASTPGTYSISYTVAATASCPQQQATTQVSIAAAPALIAPANSSVCAGSTVPATAFSGSTGATFTWMNNNTSIGLPASGTGSLPAFTATNTTNAPVSATVTVLPTATTGRFAYISNYADRTVSVINTATNTVVKTIGVGAGPWGVSVAPNGRVYVVNSADSTVSVISTVSNTVIATFPVKQYAWSICVSPDGGKIYIGHYGGSIVSVIDAASFAPLASIPTTGGGPFGMALSPDGSRLYGVNNGGYLNVINTATNAVTATVFLNYQPVGIALSPDGSRAYITHNNVVAVLNTATNSVLTTYGLGVDPTGLALSSDGSRLYAVTQYNAKINVYNTANGALIDAIDFPGAPYGIALTPDDKWLYVTQFGNSSVGVINTQTRTVTGYIPVGAGPAAWGNFIAAGASCSGTPQTFTITVAPSASASISYPGTPYCNSGSTAPVLTGTTGGTFSSSTGLSLDAASGAVNLSASTPGIYTVAYSLPASGGCAAFSTTTQVTINATASASIRYAGAPFCKAAGTASVTLTGATGGTFSATPAGLSLDAATGAINIGNSANFFYTITYTVPATGSCPAVTASTQVGIYGLPTLGTPVSQSACAGSATAPVAFSTSPSGTLVRWTNTDTSIGLAAKGYGNIASFTAQNGTDNQKAGIVTATPLKGLLYVVKSGNSNAVSVLSRAYNEVAFDIPIGSAPDGIAITRGGGLLATADWGSDQVSLISTATHAVIGTVAVGNEPYALAFTPDGTRLYVANLAGNSVSVIDVSTRSVIATIPVGISPVAIAVTPDGSKVYVTNTGNNTVSVIGTASNTVTANVTVTGSPYGIAISPDGSKAYVSRSSGLNLMAINTATNTTSLVANVGASNTGVAVSPDGSRVYVGKYDANLVYVVNTTNNTIVTTIPVGAGPLNLALSPDGGTLYTSNQSGNSVTVISTASNTVTATISGVLFPSGIATSPDAACTGASKTFSITVDPLRTATIDYAGAPFCNTLTSASVTRTGSSGGTYSASPAGLSIDAATGAINPAASAPGIYVVSYFLSNAGACPVHTATDTITVSAAATASIRYAGSPYCAGAGSIPVILAGATGGSFAAAPGGLSIDAASGTVNVSGSQPGTYTVTYTLPPVSGCGSTTASTLLTISALPTVNAMPNLTLCSGGQITADFSGTASIYDWTNSDTSIGLPAVGTGSFVRTLHNYGSAPVTSTVTVTPRNMGHQAWVPLYNNNSVFLYDIASRSAWGNIPVGTSPVGVSASPDGTRVYVTNNGSDNVSVINPNTFGVIATIPVGDGPYGVVVSPDGSRVYVANQNSANVSVINTATNSVIATIAVSGANAIAINPAGTKVYVSSYANRVYVINTGTNTVTRAVNVGGAPEGIAFTPDGSRAYIANQFSNDVTVMDASNDVVIGTMATGLQPEGVVMSPDGSKLYVVNQASDNVYIFSTATNSLLDTVHVGYYPEGASLTQDGSELYVANVGGKSISVINTASNTVVRTIPTTFNPYGLGNFITPASCAGAPTTFTVTVSPVASASIAYPGSPFCTFAAPAAVQLTGTAGGSFSAAPAGLMINAATGTIDLGGSQPGTYTVTYSIAAANGCAAFNTTTTVTVSAASFAGIHYAGSPYCAGAGTVPVIRSGSGGGSFSAQPAGLSIDATTGAINVGASTPGTYTITYFIPANGGCAAVTATAHVVINGLPTADTPASQVVCAGSSTTPVFFSGNSGYFSWTNSDTSIGLGAGSSFPEIPAFVARNTTGAPKTATITITPRFHGSYAWVPQYNTNTVNIVDPARGFSLGQIAVGSMPLGAAVSPDGSKVYVTNGGSGNVSVISTTSFGVTATIPVGASPYGVAVSPDGKKVYVANQGGSVSVIDAAANSVVATVPVSGANAIAISPDGSKVFVSSYDNKIYFIDPATNAVTGNVNVGGAPEGIAFTPNGQLAYVTNQFTNNVSALTPSGIVIATIPVGTQPEGVVVSPDGSKVFVVNQASNTVSVISVSSNSVVATIPVGDYPEGISLTQDGTQALVTNVGGKTLSVINTATLAVTSTIAVSGNPYGLGNFITPDGCAGAPVSFTITVNPAPSASINYNSVYCSSDGSATPAFSGTTGGSFTALPAGLSIDAATGAIAPTASTPGTYVVTYSIAAQGSCAAFSVSDTLSITAAPAASISYEGSPYCSNAGTANVTIAGSTGGRFSASPAGLVIDSLSGAVSPGASQPGTYTVTYSIARSGCSTFSSSTTIRISAAPAATIAYSAAAFCAGSGSEQPVISGTQDGAFSAMPAGLSLNPGTGAIDLAASAPGSYTVTYTVLSKGGCAAFSTTTSVTVKPGTSVNAVASQVVCAEGRTSLVSFSGGAPGTVYEWVNSNNDIGLAASGTGNIASFVANNGDTAVQVAAITVTPVLNGCAGPSRSFSITVNPLATVSPLPNSVFCHGGATTPVTFSSSIDGTSFTWTNSLPSIGLAASGTGPLPAFTAQNTGTTPVQASIRVTPVSTQNGLACTGRPLLVRITVNPALSVNPVASQTLCNNAATAAVAFSGPVAGTVYQWTNSNPGIGLAASGTGDIASFQATNATAAPVTATITVTPVYFNSLQCAGPAQTFTITVNPDLSGSTSFSYGGSPYCAGSAPVTPAFTGAAGGVFTAPAGLSINATTGAIDPAASQVGSYTVTYTIAGSGTCNLVSTATVAIIPATTATIAYPASPYCATGTALPVRTGTSGGVFSAAPDGLSLDAATGALNLAASAAGTYTVSYTVQAAGSGCATVVATATVTVNAVPTVNPVPNQVLCAGSPSAPMPFTGTLAGASYTWTNSNASIGLPASGSGDIASFIAQNPGTTPQQAIIRVTPVSPNGDAVCAGTTLVFAITVNPATTVDAVPAVTVCAGTAAPARSFTSPVAGTTFRWTNSNPAIGLPASGTGDVPSFLAQNATAGVLTATITVTPVFSNTGVNCTGTPTTYNISVQPFGAGTTSISYGGSPYCAQAAPAAATVTGTTGGSFSAPSGLSINTATGTIDPAASVPGTYTVYYVVSGSGLCPQQASAMVTILPTPSASIAYTASPYCQGAKVGVTRSGTTGGTFSASPAGLAINSSSGELNTLSSLPGTYTVTLTFPTGSGCALYSSTTTVTINPTPTVNPVGNQVLCAGAASAAVVFTGTAPGTSYSWTSSNPSIGLAASGSGDIASFTALNTTNTVQRATISVTPLLAGGGTECPGKALSFGITVNPRPTVDAVPNQVLCRGVNAMPVSFSGAVSGTTYNWTNNNTAVGLAASGSVNVPSFVAQNNSAAPIVATVTVTPQFINGVRCYGNPRSFAYTVNPCAARVVVKENPKEEVKPQSLEAMLQVGPNPVGAANLYIYYKGSDLSGLTWQLRDANGRLLHRERLTAYTTTHNMSVYAGGSYLLEVTDAHTGAVVRKVIVRQ